MEHVKKDKSPESRNDYGLRDNMQFDRLRHIDDGAIVRWLAMQALASRFIPYRLSDLMDEFPPEKVGEYVKALIAEVSKAETIPGMMAAAQAPQPNLDVHELISLLRAHLDQFGEREHMTEEERELHDETVTAIEVLRTAFGNPPEPCPAGGPRAIEPSEIVNHIGRAVRIRCQTEVWEGIVLEVSPCEKEIGKPLEVTLDQPGGTIKIPVYAITECMVLPERRKPEDVTEADNQES